MQYQSVKKKPEAVILAASFLCPVLIAGIGFALRGLAPFGDKSLMAIDAWGQYFPMLREAKRLFLSGQMYSLAGGLGFDLIAQGAYYTNSPLWWILFLLPGEITPAGVDLIVLLRFGLMGLCFGIWSLKVSHSPANVVVSTAYALSGYALSFIHQFMWMDALWLLPLIVLGIDLLVEKRRPWLYLAALATCIYSNFYIAYMVCIFSCLWFVKRCVDTKKKGRELVIVSAWFGLASFAAGLVNARVIYHTAKALSQTIASGLTFDGKTIIFGNSLGFLQRFLPFSAPSLVKDYPNAYVGLTCVVLAALWLIEHLGRGEERRETLTDLALTIFLIISLRVNALEYVWHGFHFPNQLPMRESFLLVFVLASLAVKAFRDLPGRKLVIAFALVLLLESSANALFTFYTHCPATSVETSLLPYEEEFASFETDLRPEETFYRTELLPYRDNGGQLYGYYGVTHYSSMMSEGAYRFFLRIGCEIYARNVSTRYNPNPVLDMLLGVRYLVGKEVPEGFGKVVETRGNLSIYEHDDVLSAAYLVDPQIAELSEEKEGFALQNEWMLRAAGLYEEDMEVIDAEGVVEEERFQLCAEKLMQGSPVLAMNRAQGGYVLEGRLRCENEGYLLVTFPFADTEVWVDGEKIETSAFLGYLTRSEEMLAAGVHEVKIVVR